MSTFGSPLEKKNDIYLLESWFADKKKKKKMQQ